MILSLRYDENCFGDSILFSAISILGIIIIIIISDFTVLVRTLAVSQGRFRNPFRNSA
jgi:hypothetical protein